MRRLASAAVLIALLVITLWLLPPWATVILTVVAAAVSGGELAAISGRVGATVPVSFVAAASAMLAAAFLLALSPSRPDAGLFATMLALAAGVVRDRDARGRTT